MYIASRILHHILKQHFIYWTQIFAKSDRDSNDVIILFSACMPSWHKPPPPKSYSASNLKLHFCNWNATEPSLSSQCYIINSSQQCHTHSHQLCNTLNDNQTSSTIPSNHSAAMSALICSAYSVFPQHCFSFKSAGVISLFGVQLSGFIHLSHVKISKLDIVFWGFPITFFFVFIENTNYLMFPVNNKNPILKFCTRAL